MDNFFTLFRYKYQIGVTQGGVSGNNGCDLQYIKSLKYILANGSKKSDRTGTGTISTFGRVMRFDMSEGFPLITSKKMYYKGIIHELIWFLRGDTNIKYLVDNNVNIWNGDAYKHYLDGSKFRSDASWGKPVKNEHNEYYHPETLTKEEYIERIKNDEKFAKEWGELGPIYGKQWRDWNGIDQIQNVLDKLKTDPNSRRLMVSAWNVNDIYGRESYKMALPPCHYGFQLYVKDGNKLSLLWTQRSCDFGLGIPYNIASYGILLHLIAKEVNMIPDELIFSGGDCHIYIDHIKHIETQFKRSTYKLPKLELNNESFNSVKFEDIKIIDYKSSEAIRMPLSN